MDKAEEEIKYLSRRIKKKCGRFRIEHVFSKIYRHCFFNYSSFSALLRIVLVNVTKTTIKEAIAIEIVEVNESIKVNYNHIMMNRTNQFVSIIIIVVVKVWHIKLKHKLSYFLIPESCSLM